MQSRCRRVVALARLRSTPSTVRRKLLVKIARAVKFIAPARLAWTPVAALAVAGLPFTAFTILVLNHFYIFGGFFYDSGLLAFLISQPDPRLPTPLLFGGESFFATHITPLFVIVGLIRHLLPVTNAQFFAGFVGVCHALPGLGVFWLLHSDFDMQRPLEVALGAIVAVAFSFNGLALAIARYPHFEMMIVGSFILFVVALIRQQPVIASICFATCLATREDAGLHLFAFLFLMILLNRLYGVSWLAQRAEIAFAMIALIYSLVGLGLQEQFFTGPSSFVRIYLGNPPFEKVTIGIVAKRLLGYPQYRTYLVLPALIAMLWAICARNPFIVLGYIAVLPWGIIHLAAQSDIAGTLSGYYGYPFMIASFWPLIGVLLDWRRRGCQGSNAVPVLAFSAIVAGSFTALSHQYDPGHLKLPESFLLAPSFVCQETTERAIEELSRSKAELGTVVVDGSILALAPDDYTHRETVSGDHDHPDTVVYFANGYEAEMARAVVKAYRLTHYYLVVDTSIRLATDRTFTSFSPLASFLTPTEALE